MYQNMYQPYQSYATNNTGIIWVQGIEGAKAYQLMPNSNAMLLDSENEGTFYIKMCDSVGMCTMRTFKFTEVAEQPKCQPTVDMSNYVTRDEFDRLVKQLGGMENGN